MIIVSSMSTEDSKSKEVCFLSWYTN